jgi:hypothetical protein
MKNGRIIIWVFIVIVSIVFTMTNLSISNSNHKINALIGNANAQQSTAAQYLPFVYNKNWENLYGYASYEKVTDLPLLEIAKYTSFIYTHHRAELGRPDEADLSALRAAGLGVILKLDSHVIEDNFDEAALRDLKARIDPYKDVIWALYVIDEPYRPNREPPYTEQELENLVARVKAIFPDYLMYVNFSAPYFVEEFTGEPHPQVPDNIDLISTDIYINLGDLSDEEYKMRVGRNLSIMLDRAHGRPVIYVAPAFGLIDDESTWPTTHQAQLDYELYEEYGLAGLAWYYYEDISADQTEWGASHWPELLDKHREIGDAILGQ